MIYMILGMTGGVKRQSVDYLTNSDIRGGTNVTDTERTKSELDKLRSEINALRGRIAMQEGAIKAIADKVAELRGQLATVANSRRI